MGEQGFTKNPVNKCPQYTNVIILRDIHALVRCESKVTRNMPGVSKSASLGFSPRMLTSLVLEHGLDQSAVSQL